MTGLFNTKYHVAIFGEDVAFNSKITAMLKSWFNNKIVVEPYTDCHQMFIDLNIAKAKNHPFDMTIVDPNEGVEAAIVLKQADPSMEVVNYKDEVSLKKETVRLTWKRRGNVSLPL